MSNTLLMESVSLAKSYIEQQSEPGRYVYENEAHDRQFIFQGNDAWEQITLNLKIGRGWDKGMSLMHVFSTDTWQINVGINNGDGTTSHVSYDLDGTMKIGLDKFSEPLVLPEQMKSYIRDMGFPELSHLPKVADFTATANLFLQQVQRGDFSIPTIISADRSLVK